MRNNTAYVRFEVRMTVTMKITVFWGLTPYRLVNVYRRLGRLEMEEALSSVTSVNMYQTLDGIISQKTVTIRDIENFKSFVTGK
jgi:hypothetical protein